MKLNDARKRPAGGSCANGLRPAHYQQRVVISFPPDLFRALADEALQKGYPFARIVRDRLQASFASLPSPNNNKAGSPGVENPLGSGALSLTGD